MANDFSAETDLSPFTPEQEQQFDQEVAEYFADELKKLLLGAWEHGISIMARGKPLAMLEGFLQNTLPEDMPKVLDPNYREKRSLGGAGPLEAETLHQARVQAIQENQQLQAQGIDPSRIPPAPDDPPLLWVYALELPPYVWDAMTSDFRRLMREQNKKAGVA